MRNLLIMVLLLNFISSCKEDKSTERNNFVRERSAEIKDKDTLNDILKIEHPKPDQLVTSPLEFKGLARGYWFFEAEATAELLDENLQHLSQTNTTATGEWMTEDWVPFSGTMTFEKPSTETGFLVLHKANASGLKEHDMSDTIPVRFRR